MSRNPLTHLRAETVVFFKHGYRPAAQLDHKDRRAAQRFGGARRDRTDDLKLAKLPLSQLSYGPNKGTAVIDPELTTIKGRGGPGKI